MPGELTIKPGDFIEVNTEDNDDSKKWMMGINGMRKGLFYTAFTIPFHQEDVNPKILEPQKSPSGYEITFMESAYIVKEKPGDDLECIICKNLANDPQQTNCCGHTLCQACAERWRAMSMNCPNCRSDKFETMSDIRIRRKIVGLTAYCPHYKDYCDWQGSIAKLEDHLSKECKYKVICCPKIGCTAVFSRKDLNVHLTRACLFRPIACPCCGIEEYKDDGLQLKKTQGEKMQPLVSYGGQQTSTVFISSHLGHSVVDTGSCVNPLTYSLLIKEHYKHCLKWPMRCSNGCKFEMLTRSTLLDHLESNCPEQVISCQFAEVGCTVRVKRKEMADHIQQSVGEHMTAMMSDYMRLKKDHSELQADYRDLKEELDVLKDDHHSLMMDHDAVKKDHAALNEDLRIQRKDHTALANHYSALVTDYDKLKKGHQKLKKGHQKLKNNHEELKEDHEELKEDHEKLKEDHEELKEDHEELKDENKELKEDHEELKEDYEKLKEDHEELKEDHEELKEDHEELKEDHEELKEDY